jgi:hypothetical protein
MPATFSPSPLSAPMVGQSGLPSVSWNGWFTQYDQLNPGILLGRSSSLPMGPPQWITLGSGLTLTGTELTATGLGGDVVGPASSTDGVVALWDGLTGKLLKNSAVSGAWFDQAVLTTSSPSFAALTVGTTIALLSTALSSTTVNLTAGTTAGVVRAYDPAFGIAGLAGKMAYGASGDVVVYNSIGSASGGSGVTYLRGGGYDTAADQATIDKNGFHVTAALFVTGKTVTVNGNTVLDNWFDQSVKAAASPTFNGLTLTSLSVNAHVVTVNGATTLDNWFDQSVKVAASPTVAALRSTGNVRADGAFASGTTVGMTQTGLQVALTAGPGSFFAFDILGGIWCNGVFT